ncbi:hypothetical protein H4R20_000644 [Coemansia guatemalensis]|uniref:Velvet domain-containing protein n=1 Tax=Coemansia guatemalensis TaxID=2761395 RepID=A0A9W8HYS7_9FUNG|nr:hypothetical protein H4R20_000644 [Coemansia guatemalensis]
MLRPKYEFCDSSEYHGAPDDMDGLPPNLPVIPTYVQHASGSASERVSEPYSAVPAWRPADRPAAAAVAAAAAAAPSPGRLAWSKGYLCTPVPAALSEAPARLCRTEGRLQKYVLEMAQHPVRARMCGFGEKDRRPLDPPPVVRLRVRDEDGRFMQSEDVDIWKFVVSATLWAPHSDNDRSVVINPNTLPSSAPVYQSSSSTSSAAAASSSVMSLSEPVKVRNLVGTTVSNAYLLKDHNDQLNIFFIFHDLSVRTEGQFRLKFQFTIIPSEEEPRAFVESVAWSSVFEIYSAKTFPGMTDSTHLSKAFAAQGIKITIWKNSRSRSYHPRPGDDPDHDEDDDDGAAIALR